MAERLGSGLQNHLQRFKSALDLIKPHPLRVGFCIFDRSYLIKFIMKHIVIVIGLTLFVQASYAQYGDYSVRVEVEGNSYAHFTEIYFEDDGWNPPTTIPTYGWDGCCDALLNLGNPWQPQVFTQVVAPPVPINNHRISINGLPHVFEHTEVPMGFLPGELAQYTFTFEELYTLPLGMSVELEDHAQNVVQDLLIDSVYTTWGAVSDDEARFTLHFYPENVTSTSGQYARTQTLTAWSNEEMLVIGGLETSGPKTAKLTDMFGRVVWEGLISEGKNDVIVNRNQLASGVYIFELITKKTKRQSLKISI